MGFVCRRRNVSPIWTMLSARSNYRSCIISRSWLRNALAARDYVVAFRLRSLMMLRTLDSALRAVVQAFSAQNRSMFAPATPVVGIPAGLSRPRDIDHYAADVALWSNIWTCATVHIAHSTGGGEATRYAARHGQLPGRAANSP